MYLYMYGFQASRGKSTSLPSYVLTLQIVYDVELLAVDSLHV